MKNPRFWIAVIVAGIVANIMDFIVQGQLLTNAFYSKIETMRTDVKPIWFIVGDFVAVLVFAWVLNRLASLFSGAKGCAIAGFYLGVLVNFPTWHFIFLMFKGYPYNLAWINTIYGVFEFIVIGAVLGALMTKKVESAAPSSA
jgi:hypothetical protein